MADESPICRGWKDILSYTKMQDRRFAIKILTEKKVLFYEGRQPVIFKLEYDLTIRPREHVAPRRTTPRNAERR